MVAPLGPNEIRICTRNNSGLKGLGYKPVMYFSDWRLPENRIVLDDLGGPIGMQPSIVCARANATATDGGVTRPFPKSGFVRVTFCASLGAWASDATGTRYCALEFKKPGEYRIELVGRTPACVNIARVTRANGSVARVDCDVFRTYEAYHTYMCGLSDTFIRELPPQGNEVRVRLSGPSGVTTIGTMYMTDTSGLEGTWRKRGNAVIGGDSAWSFVKMAVSAKQKRYLRVCFAARVGVYATDAQNANFLALEFRDPGDYVVTLTGKMLTLEVDRVTTTDGQLAVKVKWLKFPRFEDLVRFMDTADSTELAPTGWSKSGTQLTASETSRILAKLEQIERKQDSGFKKVDLHLSRQDARFQKSALATQRALTRLSTTTESMALGELDCPSLFLLAPPAGGAGAKVQRPHTWFQREMVLSFLCGHDMTPVSLTDGTAGYVVKQPRDWLKQAGPALVCTVFALKVTIVVARMTTGLPLPIPDVLSLLPLGGISDKFEDTLAEYGDAVCHVVEELDEAHVTDALGAAAVCATIAAMSSHDDLDALPQTQRRAITNVTGPAYRMMKMMLEREDPGLKRLPMVKAVTRGGNVVWVSQRNLAAFQQAQSETKAKVTKKKRRQLRKRQSAAGATGKHRSSMESEPSDDDEDDSEDDANMLTKTAREAALKSSEGELPCAWELSSVDNALKPTPVSPQPAAKTKATPLATKPASVAVRPTTTAAAPESAKPPAVTRPPCAVTAAAAPPPKQEPCCGLQ